jgi:hypothetical protein
MPPPVANAPPLPFTYQGRFQDEAGKTVVYLSKDDQAYSVSEGDVIDNLYRVGTIGATQITVTYLPLDIQQILSTESKP